MIGKRWKKHDNNAIKLSMAVIISVIVGTFMVFVGLIKEPGLTDNTIVGLGVALLTAACIFSIFLSASGYDQAKGKSLTENDLAINDIYQLMGPPVISQKHEGVNVFYTFLKDRDGYVGAFRLSESVPSFFKVVLGEDDQRRYEPYPEPESEG